MTEFKKKKARKEHICVECGCKIKSGEGYYCEEKFLGSLHKEPVKLCASCYQK